MMKILLFACIVWILMFAVCTTYTVPLNYSENGGFSVCSDIANTCWTIDNGHIVKMEG